MIEVMLDTDQPAVLEAAQFSGIRVATYADLITPAILAAFAGRLVVIDRGLGDPHNVATAADIEPGALSVASGTAKIREWYAQKRPFVTAYHDRNDWQAVNAGLVGVPAHHWVATLDGTANPDNSYPDVVQVLGEAHLGFHADLSIVWNTRWNPRPTPATAAQVAAVKVALAAQLNAPGVLERAIAAL